jgi:hypothetical protein
MTIELWVFKDLIDFLNKKIVEETIATKAQRKTSFFYYFVPPLFLSKLYFLQPGSENFLLFVKHLFFFASPKTMQFK